jgi:hypothetical protein
MNMLTVKHITETTTCITQTKQVFQSNNGWVMWKDEQGYTNEAKYGTVWIMNEHGATVTKFDLGYPLTDNAMAVPKAAY